VFTLDYGDKNEQVIELLYQELLRPKLIHSSLEEFKKHFLKQENYSPIKWLGTEIIIVDLFKNELNISNPDWANLVCNHFFNKKENNFKRDQLVNIGSERAKAYYPNKEITRGIASEIFNL
jgi:hypothetical protein